MKGVVVMFNHERNYGFIRVEGVTDEVYVNSRDIPGRDSLSVGQTVVFDTARTDRGLAARNVVPGRKQRDPRGTYSLIGLAIAALVMAAFVFGARWHWLLSWLLAISLVAFAAYGWDKSCARQGRFRVPEVTLHAMSLAGGVVGAFTGHLVFHHKTRQRRFKVVYMVSAAIWGGLLWWYLGL